jgi:hypothetical protein
VSRGQALGEKAPSPTSAPAARVARDLDAALDAHAAEARGLQRSPHWPAAALDSAALRRVVERAYGPGAAVLVHRFEGATLRSWLVRPGAEVVGGTCPRSSSEIAGILGRLHGGLAVTLAGSGGQVAFRGAELLGVPAQRRPAPARFAAAAAELSACLFPGEISAALEGVRRLLVVPTQFLGIVPYALLSPGGRGPLVETTAISIAPSAGALAPLADVDEGGLPTDPLVVGDPAPAAGSALPAAREEAEAVAAAWNTLPLLGEHARRADVVRRAETADLLYFATHGVVIPARQVGRGTGDEIVLADGGWTAWEITYARLRARLAVLSACDSALGLPSAAGVAGVARAFHQAGVPRVVASLWNVSDRATADLMVDFARALAEAEPAEALRGAMLRQRERTPDPALWGAFTAFGAPRAGFASVRAGGSDEIADACRQGCLVVFTPRSGVPRPLCGGKPACAEVYSGSGPGEEGTLWLARLTDAKARHAAWTAAGRTGRSGLTFALIEALSRGPATVYRRHVP